MADPKSEVSPHMLEYSEDALRELLIRNGRSSLGIYEVILDLYINDFRYAYNMALHTTIHTTPVFINMGREPHPQKSFCQPGQGGKSCPCRRRLLGNSYVETIKSARYNFAIAGSDIRQAGQILKGCPIGT